MSRFVNRKFEPLSLLRLLSPLTPPKDRNPIPQNTADTDIQKSGNL